MKVNASILFIAAVPLAFSCMKQNTAPATVNMVKGPVYTIDYRIKWSGKYQGPNTDWQVIMGVTTTWLADSNLVDEYSLDTSNDSGMISKHFGTFTVSAGGKCAYSSLQSYRAFTFKQDSVYYTHSDWSALGGGYGNHYEAKRIKN